MLHCGHLRDGSWYAPPEPQRDTGRPFMGQLTWVHSPLFDFRPGGDEYPRR